MKTIAVIFGGKSVEHDISIITGMQTIKNLSPAYNIIPIYITKQGEWWTGDNLKNLEFYELFNAKKLKNCFFKAPHSELFIVNKMFIKKVNINAVVMCMHGSNGEDGSLQGLLQLCNIPFTSSGVSGSAIAMDKVICKSVLKSLKIPTPRFYWFFSKEFENDKNKYITNIKRYVGFPVIVKPARLGSSVGISKCKNVQELLEAVNFASHFDNKIIVEKAIENFSEVNIACIGDGIKIECSILEKVEVKGDFLNFDDKYLNKKVKREIDCELETNVKNQIEHYAKKAFKGCDCFGVLRMDFFIDDKGKVWLNEINTIPGSLAFYLWRKNGYTFGSMLNKLINLAIIRRDESLKLDYVFNTKAVVEFAKIKNNKMNK